ncbi:MAG: hypothetical protein ACE5EG_03215 [Thermoanaerobaculia bacterium]
MSPDKPNLDQLRIDRSGLLLLLAVAIGWWTTRPSVAEVRTAAVRELRLDDAGGATVLNASGYVTARRQATPGLLVQGAVYSAPIGLVGGLFPAIRAARLPVATALREL